MRVCVRACGRACLIAGVANGPLALAKQASCAPACMHSCVCAFPSLAQVLDFPSAILLTMVVSVFTIFFPFLVVFVTGGILLEMLANLLGLLGFSRVSIVQSTGDGLSSVTWMILWTQLIAIPVVMSCVDCGWR